MTDRETIGHMVEFGPTIVPSVRAISIFSSVLADLSFNRAVTLISENRASPAFYLIPLFGSVLAITLRKPETLTSEEEPPP